MPFPPIRNVDLILRARALHAKGATHIEIGRMLQVSRSTAGRMVRVNVEKQMPPPPLHTARVRLQRRAIAAIAAVERLKAKLERQVRMNEQVPTAPFNRRAHRQCGGPGCTHPSHQ